MKHGFVSLGLELHGLEEWVGAIDPGVDDIEFCKVVGLLLDLTGVEGSPTEPLPLPVWAGSVSSGALCGCVEPIRWQWFTRVV